MRKGIIGFVMYIRLYVRHHGTPRLPLDEFHKILYLSISVHAVVKIEVAFKCDKKDGHFA